MILVTGAKGQVGGDVCARLQEQNRPFLGVDVDTLDLTDEAAVQAFFASHKEITSVIHCAAYTAVDKAEDDFERCFAVNAYGTKHLARCCGSEIELVADGPDEDEALAEAVQMIENGFGE